MSKKITATVAGAAAFLVAVNVISKGIGFLREIIFAHEFGLSEGFDLYLIAAVFPVVINTIIFYIGQNYFIPRINAAKSSGSDPSKILGSNFWLFIIAGIITSIMLFLLADPLLGAYIGPAYLKNRNLIKTVFSLFLFTIPLNAGISILSAYMNAEFEFRVPAYSQLFLNIIIVLAVCCFSGTVFIYSIPAGFIGGTILQLLFLIYYLKGTRSALRFRVSEFSVKAFFEKTIFYVILIEVIGQLYIVVDRWFYNSVDSGGIAALNYAGGLFNLPVSLISLSFSSVLLPFFARDYSTQTSEAFNDKIIEALRINTIIFVPITAVLLYFGADLITIVYERGKFLPYDTQLTFNVLRFLAISILFFSAYSILNKSLFASGKIKLLLILSISGIIIKIITSILLVSPFKQDGLALSTAIVYVFFFLLGLTAVFRSFKRLLTVFLHLIFYLLLAFLTLIPVKMMNNILFPSSVLGGIIMLVFYLSIYLGGLWLLDAEYIKKFIPKRKP